MQTWRTNVQAYDDLTGYFGILGGHPVAANVKTSSILHVNRETSIDHWAHGKSINQEEQQVVLLMAIMARQAGT